MTSRERCGERARASDLRGPALALVVGTWQIFLGGGPSRSCVLEVATKTLDLEMAMKTL